MSTKGPGGKKLTLRGQVALLSGEAPTTSKPSRLVRFPNTSNALRALLDETDATDLTSHILPKKYTKGSFLLSGPIKPFASERSKPSPNALRLLQEALGEGRADRNALPAGFLVTALPRVQPVEIRDGLGLGRLVRIRRQMLELTQQQVADLAGVGRRFIGELESGKATAELGKALEVCRVLGVSLTAAVSDGR